MTFMISTEKLKTSITSMSNKSLLALETRLSNRIAGLEKCSPWPALIHSIAADLEIVWMEQKRRAEQKSHDKR